MTAQTVKKVMEQRLIRGTPVIVADSFGKAALRGEHMIVASKGPVKCNGRGRCAGEWCAGLSVFVSKPNTNNEDKEMGWRGGTTKICLTHLKDGDGLLVIAPPALRSVRSRITAPPAVGGETSLAVDGVVTWEALACAVADQDWALLTRIARTLKRENEGLKNRVIEVQNELIGQLQAR